METNRHKYKKITNTKLECGLMPNVMAALPNIGGALSSTPQRLATTGVLCINAAKTRNPLILQGCPKLPNRSHPLGRKFTILWEHVEEILLLKIFFRLSIGPMCLSCEDIVRQSCAMVPRWRFLRPVFPASRAQHSKFSLGPHHV